MLNRSHHMPTLIRIDATHMTGMLVRMRFDQKICGTTTLQNTIEPEDARASARASGCGRTAPSRRGCRCTRR